jgi:hypothetical protein
MKTSQILVRVTARVGVNLKELAGDMSPISVACGSAGPSIARQIISGDGMADVPLSLIQLATDTQDGVEAIFDNFALSDPRTAKPLFNLLIKAYLGN